MLTISPRAPLTIYGRAIQDVPLEPVRIPSKCLDGRRHEYSHSDGKRGFRSTREYIIRWPVQCESNARSAILGDPGKYHDSPLSVRSSRIFIFTSRTFIFTCIKINKKENMYSLVEFIFHLKFFIIKKKIYIYIYI